MKAEAEAEAADALPCVRCGKKPRHTFEKRDGTRKTIRFCAVCAWDNVTRAVDEDGIRERDRKYRRPGLYRSKLDGTSNAGAAARDRARLLEELDIARYRLKQATDLLGRHRTISPASIEKLLVSRPGEPFELADDTDEEDDREIESLRRRK